MFNIGTYECFLNSEFFDTVEVVGAVGNISVGRLRGNMFDFDRTTGKCTSDPTLELRAPNAPDMKAISNSLEKLSAAVYNTELSDADFRARARELINDLINEL